VQPEDAIIILSDEEGPLKPVTPAKSSALRKKESPLSLGKGRSKVTKAVLEQKVDKQAELIKKLTAELEEAKQRKLKPIVSEHCVIFNVSTSHFV